jgi:hypothetical protein
VDACRGSGILPGKPDPAEAGTPDHRYLDEKRKLYTAVDACRGSGILPGKPDPAEAGTPDQRYLDEKRKHYTAVGCLHAAAERCIECTLRLRLSAAA